MPLQYNGSKIDCEENTLNEFLGCLEAVLRANDMVGQTISTGSG